MFQNFTWKFLKVPLLVFREVFFASRGHFLFVALILWEKCGNLRMFFSGGRRASPTSVKKKYVAKFLHPTSSIHVGERTGGIDITRETSMDFIEKDDRCTVKPTQGRGWLKIAKMQYAIPRQRSMFLTIVTCFCVSKIGTNFGR